MKKRKKTKFFRQDAPASPETEQASPPKINEKKKKKSRIVGEVKEKREKNIKHFLKEDLTFEAAIYNEAVHYYSDGEWKDINNSIVEGKDDENNDVLENKDNDIKVKISKKVKSKKLVTIQKGKYQISWGIDKVANSDAKVKEKTESGYREDKNHKSKHISRKHKLRQIESEDIKTENQLIQAENLKKQTLSNLSSTIEFSNVYPNIDLEYTITSNKFKESIIIKDKVNNPVFTFNLDVKNLVPVIQEDYSIVFYDDKNTSLAVFKIDSPFMYDSRGQLSKDITVNLLKDNESYTLTWVPNNDWLQDRNRSYPVTIDPTITTSTDINATMDSFVRESSPNGTAAEAGYLRVGKDTAGRYISFIKFTLPVESLTAADFITGANLYLAELTSSNYTSLQINAYKVLQNWSSGSVTWNNQPSIDESTVEDYQLLPIGANEDFYLDITSMVRSWFLLGNNYGVALKSDVNSTGYVDFVSSDSQYTNSRPRIAISYVNNSGIENYWTYHSQDVRRAGTGYINDYNGNLIFVHNDISMSGSKMPLTINHVFNSSEKDKNAFSVASPTTSNYGYGWRLNLSQRVESLTIGIRQYYVYTDEDGTKHYFLYDSTTNTYNQETSTDLTFTKNSDGTYSIKDKSGGILEFTNTGYLYKIKDKNENVITLSYDGTILKKITDGAGRVTTLEVNSIGYLLSITEPSGRKTLFSYNGAQLEKITYEDGNYSMFKYDTTNNLLEAGNYDKGGNLTYKIKYTYNSQKPYRVIKVEEFGLRVEAGGTLDISYENNMTTFKDIKGRKNYYQFNDYGNTISVKDNNGGAEYYKYMRDIDSSKPNLSNKLSLESKLQRFKRNYLKNHNAETADKEWVLDTWETSAGYKPTGEFTTETSYMGARSLKVTRTTKSSRDFYSQQLNLTKGEIYTFSAYIKTKDISSTNGKGAALFINYQYAPNEWNTVESTMIQGTNDWNRYEVKFTLPAEAPSGIVYARAGIVMEKGTAYFDCLQLESGSTASRYNLVENADLFYTNPPISNQVLPASWDMNSAIESTDTVEYKDGVNGFKVKGVTNKEKYMSQTINVSGKAGDNFVMSALGKSWSVPLDKTIDKRRRFSIELGLTRQGYSYPTEWHTISFNEATIEWQYISDVIVAQNDYVSVTIYAEYYNNANYSYFTEFGLYKDEFGTSYAYDDKGNVVSIDDLAKQKSTFEYNGNSDLMKATMPSNGVFKYEYDPKRNISKATSATNVVYTFSYDSSGNPLKSRVGDAPDAQVGDTKLFMESTGSYSISGNYLKALIDNEENSVISQYDEVKGLLTGTIDGKGSKTSYEYDNMDRITRVSKRIESSNSRNIEKFPLATSTIGSKGTKPLVADPSLNRTDGERVSNGIFYTTLDLPRNPPFKNSTNEWTLDDWNKSIDEWRKVYNERYELGSRISARFLYDLGLDKKSGTMSLWFYTSGTGARMILSNENSTALFNLYIGSDNKIVLNSLNKAGVIQNIIVVNDITIVNNQWYFAALKWELKKEDVPIPKTSTLYCTLYINNKVYTGAVSDFRDFTGVITAIGSNVYGKYDLTGAVDDFSYSRNPLDNASMQLLYNKTMPEDQGTVITNSYTYENDRIKTVSHNGFNYSFEYDSLGNNNKVLVGSQELITNSFEASTGNLSKSVYGNNQGVTIDYDTLDRITSRKFSRDATAIDPIYEERYTYDYNNEGNLGYHEDKVNKKGYRYTYDLSDRLVKIDEINNDVNDPKYKNIDYTKFGYDSSNNQSIVTEKIDNKIYETRYAYDKDNKPVGVFYDPAVEDSTNFEYFHLSENSMGSKGTVPEIQTPVFIKDANGEGALYVYPGTKVIYNLGLNKSSGTMTVWMKVESERKSKMILGNEGTVDQLFNVYIDEQQKVNLAIRNNSGIFTNVITTDETINYNAWHFVAVSWQFDWGSLVLTCRLYLNSRKYETSIKDFKDFTGNKTAIGTNIGGDYPLKGLIRKFNYSSSFLTEAEVLSMYANKSVRYLYDKLGRVRNKTINIGRTSFETQYAYVSVTGKEQGATINRLSTIQNGLTPIGYYYDANGNITRIRDNRMDNIYYYNELNELIQEDNQVLNKTVLYSYDAGGNIRSKRDILYGVAAGSQPPTIYYSYDDVWKDKLISYNGIPIDYDKIGNPTTIGVATDPKSLKLNWEEGRRLKSITSSEKNTSFKYNDAGIRTEKNVDGVVTKYHLIGDRVTYEYTEDINHVIQDTIYYRYDNADDLVSMNLNGVEYYYIRNGQGDIIGLLDGTGKQVVSYIYDSWGKVISVVDNTADGAGDKNPYRYRGYRYDKETGLYYLNSRYYNPIWGRYLNADALGGSRGDLLSHNVFAYCKNNPVNMTDPNGYLPSWVKWAAVAVVAAIVVVAVVAIASPATFAAAVTMGTAVLTRGAQVAQRVGQRAVQVASRVSQSASRVGHIKSKGYIRFSTSKNQSSLDWSIVSRTGETRVEHVAKHAINDLTKADHGIFYGNPVKVVNSAWSNAGNMSHITSRSVDIYHIPFENAGYAGGYGGQLQNLNHITIITRQGTNKLITAYPGMGGSYNINLLIP